MSYKHAYTNHAPRRGDNGDYGFETIVVEPISTLVEMLVSMIYYM